MDGDAPTGIFHEQQTRHTEVGDRASIEFTGLFPRQGHVPLLSRSRVR
jgi:hypothetical protein